MKRSSARCFGYDVSKHAPHWNELLPGDMFYTYEENDHFISTSPTQIYVNHTFAVELNKLYLVISRRVGKQYPKFEDNYVLLASNFCQEIML
jgi:hypothetical protein